MPDVYAEITAAQPAILDRLINVLELRAADPRQKEMRDAYLARLTLPKGARILEAGCGTGAVARDLAGRFTPCDVVGLDPSPIFLARARELAATLSNLRFDEGDARDLPYDSGSFDAVVFHTCLCHIPDPAKALRQAFRVLRRGARLAVFDGDYATTTFAIGDHDPL